MNNKLILHYNFNKDGIALHQFQILINESQK